MPRTIDDDFADIAALAPGFGGLYFDEVGDLIVNTTDLGSRAALENAIRAAGYFRPSAGTSRTPLLRLRQAQYDWRVLKQWRDALDRAWPRGMNRLDIDEVTNRIAVGLESELARSSLEAVLAAKAIPPEAVVVRSAGPITLDIGGTRVPDVEVSDGQVPERSNSQRSARRSGGDQLLAAGPL